MKRETIDRAFNLCQKEKEVKEVLKFLERKGTRLDFTNFNGLEPSCLEKVTREKLDELLAQFKSSLKEDLDKISKELDSI